MQRDASFLSVDFGQDDALDVGPNLQAIRMPEALPSTILVRFAVNQ